jgi:hypothetical protein
MISDQPFIPQHLRVDGAQVNWGSLDRPAGSDLREVDWRPGGSVWPGSTSVENPWGEDRLLIGTKATDVDSMILRKQ